MKQLKVAIIGQGRSGYSIHGSFLIDNKDRFKVVAVVDLIEKRRLLAKERYGEDVITSDNYQDLFDMNLDLVINSSYSHMHYSITKDLLMHGFNVLTEKPFCGTADEVQDLIDTAKEKKCMLAVFQNSRFAAYYMKVKEILDSKVLGDIIQVSINFSGLREDGIGRRFSHIMQVIYSTQDRIRLIRLYRFLEKDAKCKSIHEKSQHLR
jgi:predicted dehydrogenase